MIIVLVSQIANEQPSCCVKVSLCMLAYIVEHNFNNFKESIILPYFFSIGLLAGTTFL